MKENIQSIIDGGKLMKIQEKCQEFRKQFPKRLQSQREEREIIVRNYYCNETISNSEGESQGGGGRIKIFVK